ncbi:MAG: hypothetical protein ACC642_01660 [Pseudomonadales bacterium]
MLLEGIEDRERLFVLDVGSGSQSTVDFFSQYNARIHFVDLFSNELFICPPEEIDEESACLSFIEYMDLPAEVTFDICLFWDALHRIDLVALQGLSRALCPHVDGRTLGYGFGTLYAQTLEHCRYGICDQDHLTVRPVEAHGRFYSHTQQQLSEYFTSLTIQRATLLREGRLELLLCES